MTTEVQLDVLPYFFWPGATARQPHHTSVFFLDVRTVSGSHGPAGGMRAKQRSDCDDWDNGDAHAGPRCLRQTNRFSCHTPQTYYLAFAKHERDSGRT